MQMTPLGPVSEDGNMVRWTPNSSNGKLSLIASFDKVGDASFKKKEFEFKVQTKEDNKGGRFVTVGKCTVDLAKRYEERATAVTIRVPVKKDFLGQGESGSGMMELGFNLRIVPVKGLSFDDDDDEAVSDEELEDVEEGEEPEVPDHEENSDSNDNGGDAEEQADEDNDDTVTKPVEEAEVGASPNSKSPPPMNDDLVPRDNNWQQEPEIEPNPVAPQRQKSIQKQNSGISGVSVTILQKRLEAAEQETRETRRMLEESINMLEDETALRQEADEAVQSLEREIDWLEKKAVKDRADWENRMKESLHKMESTVVLLETLQREKEEMEARIEKSNAELSRLKDLADASFVEQKIKTAEAEAKRRAEGQAAIEAAALKKQINEMASRLEAAEASRSTGIGVMAGSQVVVSALAGGGGKDELEEANKQLSLENQYLKIEVESLKQDAASAKAAAARVEQSSRREAEVYAQRAADYADQLKESQRACAEAERGAAEARSRIILLEDAVERGNLVAAELRQRIALKEMTGSVSEAAINGDASQTPASPRTMDRTRELEDVMRLMREAQDSAEARASQLASVTQELQAVSEELTEAKQHALDAQREADDACRLAMTMEEEAKSLRLEIKARDEYRKDFDINELRDQTSHAQKEDAEQSSRAHQLAQEASQMAAALTEKLAYSNQEKIDLRARLEETRQELHKARSENDVELRKRVDALERDLVVSKNRAEVNAIFREEHDRLARELIEAKIGLAESSEELIVAKRALWKSQEKGLSLASSLTKLETKFYSVGGRRKKKRGDRKKPSSP